MSSVDLCSVRSNISRFAASHESIIRSRRDFHDSCSPPPACERTFDVFDRVIGGWIRFFRPGYA